MPDAQIARGVFGALDWVGMAGIALPLQAGARGSSARVNLHVNLCDQEARGIHMSRLYLLADELSQKPLTPITIKQLLQDCIRSQAGLSTQARLRISLDWLMRAPALVSQNSGWRAYPVVIEAIADGRDTRIQLQVELCYSSTCPSSAALARQVLQQRFAAQFSEGLIAKTDVEAWLLRPEGGSVATAHAQRSLMQVQIPIAADAAQLPVELLITKLEAALQTPVQTAVKRVDEQAFTERNGANLMFVEDALRCAKRALVELGYKSGRVQAQHLESLHAHDATGELSWVE
jgi:GTP cyclohydrolase IB